jgi:hypothetical protein
MKHAIFTGALALASGAYAQQDITEFPPTLSVGQTISGSINTDSEPGYNPDYDDIPLFFTAAEDLTALLDLYGSPYYQPEWDGFAGLYSDFFFSYQINDGVMNSISTGQYNESNLGPSGDVRGGGWWVEAQVSLDLEAGDELTIFTSADASIVDYNYVSISASGISAGDITAGDLAAVPVAPASAFMLSGVAGLLVMRRKKA